MKDLNKVYPRITRLMWLWHFFTAAVIVIMMLFFTMAAKETPFKVYVFTMVVGLVLVSIPIYGFVAQMLSRHWVRSRCIGFGHGILYLADGTEDTAKLREVVAELSKTNLIGKVVTALRRNASARVPLTYYKQPKGPVLAIAQSVVVHQDARFRGKKWKVMGLQLGNRIWVTWLDANERTYRSLIGHELGEVVLSASGFNGSAAERHMVIAQAGLDHIFQMSRQRDKTPKGPAVSGFIRKTVPETEA